MLLPLKLALALWMPYVLFAMLRLRKQVDQDEEEYYEGKLISILGALAH